MFVFPVRAAGPARATLVACAVALCALPFACWLRSSHGIADALARRAASIITMERPPAAGRVSALHSAPLEGSADLTLQTPASAATVARGNAARSRLGGRPERWIRIGPQLVKSALVQSARPVAAWTERTSAHPAGLQIVSVGALGSVVRVGDILFEAEGSALRDVGELIAIVGQAYQRRSNTVNGRLWRAGEPWQVTVAPGW